MSRIEGTNPVFPLEETPSSLIVKVGDKQWTVRQKGIASSMHRGAEEGDADEEVWVELPAQPKSFQSRLLKKFSDSMEDLLQPLVQEDKSESVHPLLTQKFGSNANRRKPVPRTTKKRSLRETFQFGCILGLLLGCISMVLFHQIEPNTGPESRTANEAYTLATGPSALQMPAVKIQMLQSEGFSTENAAQAKASWVTSHGAAAVVHKSGNEYVLWLAAAVQEKDLKPTQELMDKIGLKTNRSTFYMTAKAVPVLTGTQNNVLEKTSAWMSSAVSALTALVAVQEDGGALNDATTAYQTATAVRVPVEVLNETGKGKLLNSFSQHLDGAFSSTNQQKKQDTMLYVLNAYNILSEIQE